MIGFIKRLTCLLYGHTGLSGYFLEYEKPTAKEQYGYYHDLVFCNRCGIPYKLESEMLYWAEYKKWMEKLG